MSGFPDIPNRSAFGPQMKNARRPNRAETDLNADQMNLVFWQAAGLGRVLPQAVILYDPAVPDIEFQALAFDPKGVLAKVTNAKTGVGDYRFTFDSTYKDQRGADVSFQPAAVMAFAQDGQPDEEVDVVLNGLIVDVKVNDVSASPTPVDRKVVLLVWRQELIPE